MIKSCITPSLYNSVILKITMVFFKGCGCGEWECNDGQCINEDSLCDTKLDCDDESDESDSQCGAGGTLMTVLIAQIQLAEQLG